MDDQNVDGKRVIVQVAKDKRRKEANGQGGRGGYRVDVEGLDERTSWQDLKDFARAAGNVLYADVWSEHSKKFGVIEYRNVKEVREAVKMLDDSKLDGAYVRLYPHNLPNRSRSRSRSHSPRRSGRSDRSRSPRRSDRSRSPRRRPTRRTSRDRFRSNLRYDDRR